MAAAMVRPGRNFRSGRFRARHESGSEEYVRLDWTKEISENVKEILQHVVQQNGVSKGKKLGYLNCFVKLINKYGKDVNLGVRSKEILICLRVGLLHEAKEVRAATLRVMRHLLPVSDTLDCLFYLHLDYLVARCLDTCMDNEIERVHAIKLIRKICQVSANKLSPSLIYPLLAVANDGAMERDRLLRVCLASVCEIAFHNTPVLSKCGGVSSILRNILACHQYPRLNESLVCTVLYLLNHPRTRHYIKANTDLEQLLAPFTDCHFRYNGETEHSHGDSREARFSASRMALITVMRSWPGLIRLCHPEGSGLQSLIGILYLPFAEIRRSIIELIFDLFRLSLPQWTEDFASALVSVDPSEMQEAWRLTEGFVAEEGRSILPHMAKTRPNLVENHLALILCAWIHAGILEALVEVICSSEGSLFVRAVILVGELLHLANQLLPSDCSNHSHCLPSLISLASSFDVPVAKRHQASRAVTYLSHFHSMKKRGVVPSSLFLDQLLQHAGKFVEYNGRHWHLRRDKLAEKYFTRSLSEDLLSQAVKDSQVLVTKDNTNWDWDLVCALLKWPDEKLRKLDDQTHIRFIKRLVFFYKPTNDMFSRIDANCENGRKLCDTGCHLIDFLIKSNQDEAQKHITDWLTDIAQCLNELTSRNPPPESVLSLSSIHSSLSQYYFLFVGRFSLTPRGDRYLEKTGVYQNLLDLMSGTSPELYIKLATSCLNYSRDGTARTILSKALTSATESARVYSTKLMRVLLRTGIAGFATWGMDLLITQLYDQSQSVAMAAINIIDEACDVQTNLDQLVKLRPTFLHLGHRGVMVLCRFMSTQRGFKSLMDANFVTNELLRWEKTYNLRYVTIVEEQLNEALTTYEKTYQGQFTRRSIQKRPKKDVFLPVHLYGQLCQLEEGLELLKKEECLKVYIQHIHSLELLTDEDILKLKTALWAVGHVGTSSEGVTWLDEEGIIPEIIRLAEECGVFSVRGTAFYVLGLFACTKKGTEVLAQYGWESVCHTRADQWPVTLEQGYLPLSLGAANSISNISLLSAFKPETDRSQMSGNSQLSFIQEEGKGDMSDQSFTCDKSDTQSIKSASNIPRSSEKLHVLDSNGHSLSNFPKSRTLPLESGEFARYQSMPIRSTLANGQPHPVVRVRAASDDRELYENRTSVGSTVIETFSETFKEKTVIISTQTDSDQLDTASDPGLPENNEEKGKEREREAVFKIGGSVLRDDRSSSESSHRSKSRTSSFNTDSTTSGVSSCESGALTSGLVTSLSPIASTSSLNTIGSTQIPAQQDNKEPVHPSSVQRRLAKLTRVPSLRRRSAAPALGIFPSGHSGDSSTFTTHRDAVGYATLRIIKRKRTYSSEGEDQGLGPGFGDSLISRTYSTESDSSVDSSIWLSIRRNISSASLPDYEGPGSSPFNTLNKNLLQPSANNSNFIGLCLPVDVYMIFEVIEGEDHRSSVAPSHKDSFLSDKIHTERKITDNVPALTNDIKMEHTADICLVCVSQRYINKATSQDLLTYDDIPAIDSDSDVSMMTAQKVDVVQGQSSQGLKTGRQRVGSASSATPGSVNSHSSMESAGKKLSEENAEGRELIRKEIMRLIINLGSSVGAKGTEQGLLSLKQKFPKAFRDMCFFSEVCHLISTYSFRLIPRRFIQELFDDLDISPLLEEPRLFLDITEPESEETHKRMTLIQGGLDPFPESNA